MKVPAKCDVSARQGRAADLRVIFTSHPSKHTHHKYKFNQNFKKFQKLCELQLFLLLFLVSNQYWFGSLCYNVIDL